MPAAIIENCDGVSKSGWMMLGPMKLRAKTPITTLGHAGQDLEDGLQHPPDPGVGVLGEVDGRSHTDRRRHQHGDAAHDEGRHHDRAQVEPAPPREPAGVPQVAEIDRPQEVDGPVEQRPQDEGADDDGQEGRREQQRPDDRLLAEAAPVAAAGRRRCGSVVQ